MTTRRPSDDDASGGRPNVLFIITDQHRADHVGFAGNDVVRTPELDAIANRGMVFDQAWVANPVCMPNRSSLMTGRLPTAHGVIFNDRSLEWGASTYVRTFRDAGWRTALIGKSHLQHGMSRDTVHPLDVTPVARSALADTWNELEHFEHYLDGRAPEFPDDFYGFGTVELAIDHGARVTGHHLQWALDKGANYEDLVVPYTSESPFTRRSDRWWQVYDPPYDPELHSTSFVTERTIAFIEDAARADEPWLAWASFPDPHHPMAPPGQWFDRHDPADMGLPDSLDEPLETAPAYLRYMQQTVPSEQRRWVQPCGATDHELVKEAIAATYGMIEMIDHGVGQIMARIAALGQLDNTIVVFTSDHGDMMGEHGLMLKGFMPFRGTQQVSLVIDDPRRGSGRTDSLASSIDVASTLLDLAGLDEYHGMQGASLVPVLDDPVATVRDHVLIEDDLPDHLAGRIPAKSRTVVCSDGTKYTRQSSGDELLFDLGADPAEVVDLSGTDAVRRANALERLADALIAADDQARGAPIAGAEAGFPAAMGV